jgi:quinol monooxygenase YgiN
MQVLVVEFRSRAEHVGEFEAAMLANAKTSRETEPGCRQFDVCRDATDHSVFFLYELYDDAAAIEAHVQSAHFRYFDQLTAPWVQSKKVWRYERQAPA